MDAKERVSALMDGGLARHEAGGAIAQLRDPGEAREAWRLYHLIGDALREQPPLSPGFAERVAARLASEPSVLAPQPRRHGALPAWAYAAAASLAVAFVGGTAFLMTQHGAEPQAPVAAAQPQPAAPAEARELAQVPPPAAADDYLLAHQVYSPRNSFQGMAGYVRTVSDPAGESGR